jgi:hypothetical protein
MTARKLVIAACAVLLGCPGPESESKAIATAAFPKTWDELEAAPQGPAPQAAAPAPETTGPSKPIDVLELTDGTELVGIITQQAPGQFVVLVTAAGEQHTVPWARIRSGAASPTMATSTPAPAPAPVVPAPPAQMKRGVVVLKDGTKVTGVLERVEPGQYVMVKTPDGGERTISWDRVSEVNVAPDAATPR